MDYLFFNSPVQNGDFTFAGKPGKAVGIRIAEALNHLLGSQPVPHLWNTVRLDGDLRYRRHAVTESDSASREVFETAAIAAKYSTGPWPAAGTVTDADSLVAQLALEVIECRLSAGVLKISSETVQICARCAHMTSSGGHPCRACSHTISHAHTARHLVAEHGRATPLLDFAHLYALHRRAPLHLRDIAGNVPARLILSRTRDHGIALDPLGLPDLVLDPRAGIHITVLAAARASQGEFAVMTTTTNAAANIAAYGQHFTDHDELRLLYALHGHVPYERLADLHDIYEACHLAAETRTAFETWFLPLFALREKNGIRADQLPALFKYFRRAILARPAKADDTLADLRQSIREGDTDWMGRKAALAAALGTLSEVGRVVDQPD
ncbi:MAG: hypothetical protein ACRDS9_16175 [Pseudonocardiaceae bacterium]